MAMIAPHGGRLNAAARRWGIDPADWLDVSTGIAPWAWPVPELPRHVWVRLPEDDDGLIAAAARYYGVAAERLLAVPGSQFALREWPRQRPAGRVAVPRVGYTEHARAWQAAGHEPVFYDRLAELFDDTLACDHGVVLAPNNPTGEMPDAADLARLAARFGVGRLVIDAAFADCRQIATRRPDTAIVLRSVGKFFGLAGIRLGFVIAPPSIINTLAAPVQPWGVAHPSRWIGARALADARWQAEQRARIAEGEAWLVARLREAIPQARLVSGGLFVTAFFDAPETAGVLYERLATRGILARLGDNQRWLRFGLVTRAARERLARGLQALT